MLLICSLPKLRCVLMKKDMFVLNLLTIYCLQQVVLTISGGGVGRGGSDGWAAIFPS